jgi:hypothetical protein
MWIRSHQDRQIQLAAAGDQFTKNMAISGATRCDDEEGTSVTQPPKLRQRPSDQSSLAVIAPEKVLQ